jgi:hypothetical protein
LTVLKGDELEFPDQPRPGAAVHCPLPGAHLRDIAASRGITERSACGIVTGLTVARYEIKGKDGRRNRYPIQAHLPMPEPSSQNRKADDDHGPLLPVAPGTWPPSAADPRCLLPLYVRNLKLVIFF